EVAKDYVLVAQAPGFMTSSETITVPDDERLQLALPLTPGQDPKPTEVKLQFIDPEDGATVTTGSVTVYGSVSGFQVAAATVNGVTAELVGAGGFAATVALEIGANTIEAVATGVAGESVSGTLTVHRAQVIDPGAGGGGSGEGAGEVKGSCA